MSGGDIQQLVFGVIQGIVSSTAFLLILFIGFCVLLGLPKLKKTAGNAMVVKSLDETITHKPMEYMPPTTPRGTTDQLHAPELAGAAARH